MHTGDVARSDPPSQQTEHGRMSDVDAVIDIDGYCKEATLPLPANSSRKIAWPTGAWAVALPTSSFNRVTEAASEGTDSKTVVGDWRTPTDRTPEFAVTTSRFVAMLGPLSRSGVTRRLSATSLVSLSLPVTSDG